MSSTEDKFELLVVRSDNNKINYTACEGFAAIQEEKILFTSKQTV